MLHLTQPQVGATVQCRIIGYRPMDSLASLSLKPSVVEQEVFSYQQLTPGMPVTGTLLTVSETGGTLQIAPGLKAGIPAPHLSDVGIKLALKKLKVGQKVTGRVWSVDPTSRHCHVTLRKQLVESKVAVLATYEDAAPGVKAYGMITGVQEYGIFVSFYGGVKGLVRSSECALSEGQKITDAYESGQIVKCAVIGVETTPKGEKKLKLSLRGGAAADDKNAASDPLANFKEGQVRDRGRKVYV